MMDERSSPPSRRDLLTMIGMAAGTTAMYAAMTELGHAAESTYTGPVKLSGDPKGTTVLVLGAGMAGMTSALELRNAGYKVQLLEYQDRAGGRNWSIRGGDTIREMGSTQVCQFDKGLYLNPGPWRIPYHHHAIIDYCRRLKVPLEPFIQVNYNAVIHSTKAFGGKPQKLRAIQADFQGHVAELLAKGSQQGMLDKAVTKEDREILLEALKNWGALDDDYGFTKNHASANRRGYEIAEGGGLTAPEYSDPMSMHDVLQSKMWAYIGQGFETDHQSTIFQPVGGMGRIGDAFARELGPIIKLNCKVVEIKQDSSGVTVSYVDTQKGGPVQTATAEYCINTIPAPVLSQIPMQVSPKMKAAIMACQYSTNFKAGLQFKRKFWEEDEAIYGGISYTDLPISLIGYPNTGYAQTGKGILLGAYVGGRPATHEFAAMAPEERLKKIVAYGAQIHPQYNTEYENGISVAWSRLPWIAGCLSSWTEERRAQHYQTLISFDGRMLLAGEHASYGIWQEHAILSGLNAIKTLHQRVTAA
jgi:monoamine oxidase